MQLQKDISLAAFTSLKVGGNAENFYLPSTYDDVVALLKTLPPSEACWFLGFGSNSLISDSGLPGATILWRGGNIELVEDELVADAGAWWDDVVVYASNKQLWGLELMSEIPSSVGGAVFGNIAAYGQQVSDTLSWVEVFDRNEQKIKRLKKEDITFAYRESSLQSQTHLIILRVAFKLAPHKLHDLRYASAVAVAEELGSDTETLEGRRQTIIETRRRAGSIYHPDDQDSQQTAGSFFKNPLVTIDQAKHLARYDETGKTLARIHEQNKIHGGDSHRASAAHVLLAAGFNRGQTWGNVRLHPDHVLKIETLEGATASDVHNVVKHIVMTVQDRLDITLTPEVRFLGDFS